MTERQVPTMPSDVNAEQCVLGSVFLRPKLAELVGLPSRAFYDPRCRLLWETLGDLVGQDRPIDVATVEAELRRTGKLEGIGVPFISECALIVPTAENVEEYARIVRARHVERQLILELSEVIEATRCGEYEGAAAVSLAFERLARITIDTKSGARRIGDIAADRAAALMALVDRKNAGEIALTGIPSGIDGLDTMLGGLQRQIITLIAARPGVGKSALSHHISDYTSAAGYGVHVFSMEDPEDGYADRTIAKGSGIPAQQLRQLSNIGRAEASNIMSAAEELRNREGWIVDSTGAQAVDEIVRQVRTCREKNGTQLVIIDYAQLLQHRRGENQMTMLDRSTKALLALAKNDDLAVVLLSQLNRECEKRDNKRPRLPDLKGSGALEEEPKSVLFLYREHYYNAQAPDNTIEIHVAKNNNGETGTVYADWNGPMMKVG